MSTDHHRDVSGCHSSERFRALAGKDRLAELPDLGVSNRGLVAHQDGTRVVRDHGLQELTVSFQTNENVTPPSSRAI
jgi:hypothetical protein